MTPLTNSSQDTQNANYGKWKEKEDDRLKKEMLRKFTKTEVIDAVKTRVNHTLHSIERRITILKKEIEQARPRVAQLKAELKSNDEIKKELGCSNEDIVREWKAYKANCKHKHVYCWNAWEDRLIRKYLDKTGGEKDEEALTELAKKISGGDGKEIRPLISTRAKSLKKNQPEVSKSVPKEKWTPERICRLIKLKLDDEKMSIIAKDLKTEAKLCKYKWTDLKEELYHLKTTDERISFLRDELGLEPVLIPKMLEAISKSISSIRYDSRRKTSSVLPAGRPVPMQVSTQLPNQPHPFSAQIHSEWRTLPPSFPLGSMIVSDVTPVNITETWTEGEKNLLKNLIQEYPSVRKILAAAFPKDALPLIKRPRADVGEAIPFLKNEMEKQYPEVVKLKVMLMSDEDIAEKLGIKDVNEVKKEWLEYKTRCKVSNGHCWNGWEDKHIRQYLDKRKKYLSEGKSTKDKKAFKTLVTKLKGERGDWVKARIRRRKSMLEEADIPAENLTSCYTPWTPEKIRFLIILNLKEEDSAEIAKKLKRSPTICNNKWNSLIKKLCELKTDEERRRSLKTLSLKDDWINRMLTKIHELTGSPENNSQYQELQALPSISSLGLPPIQLLTPPLISAVSSFPVQGQPQWQPSFGYSPNQGPLPLQAPFQREFRPTLLMTSPFAASTASAEKVNSPTTSNLGSTVKEKVLDQMRFGCKVDEIAEWNNLDKKQIEKIWDQGKMGKYNNDLIEEWTFADDRCLRMFLNERTSMTIKEFNEFCAQNYSNYEPEKVFNYLQKFAKIGSPR